MNNDRGVYTPAFFTMYVDGECKLNPLDMSIKDLGTFMHEYTHYIQNISTSFGLMSTQNYLIYIESLLKEVREKNIRNFPPKQFIIPPIVQNNLLRFKLHAGDKNALEIDFDDIKIVKKGVDLSTKGVDPSTFKTEMNVVLFYKGGSLIREIKFGSHIIKESMALLVQKELVL
jgi:hypothetical protein